MAYKMRQKQRKVKQEKKCMTLNLITSNKQASKNRYNTYVSQILTDLKKILEPSL